MYEPPHDVFIFESESAVVRLSKDAAKVERRARELFAETNIEGDVAVVHVHVQSWVPLRMAVRQWCEDKETNKKDELTIQITQRQINQPTNQLTN